MASLRPSVWPICAGSCRPSLFSSNSHLRMQSSSRSCDGGNSGTDECSSVPELPHSHFRFIRRDLAVTDADDAVRVLGDVAFVGDENDGIAFGMKLIEELHDLDSRLRI